MTTRTRVVAWGLWLATMSLCAAGLVVTLVVTQLLTLQVLAEGAAFAVAFPLGYATVGLVLGLRRPANPIGWLFATSGLVWSLTIPLDPWLDQLVLENRPLPLAAKLAAVIGEYNWAPSARWSGWSPAAWPQDSSRRPSGPSPARSRWRGPRGRWRRWSASPAWCC